MSARASLHVVDDDDAFRRALLRLLRASGFEAHGYASADDILRRPPLARPGCLVLDLRMPGLSGLELLGELRGAGVDLPAIFLTGHGDSAAKARAAELGAAAFLSKPVAAAELLATIGAALAEDRARREEERGAALAGAVGRRDPAE